MLDFDNDIVIHMPTSVQLTSSDAARTLEQAWERRRAELADWQPSGGWLAQPTGATRKSASSSWAHFSSPPSK